MIGWGDVTGKGLLPRSMSRHPLLVHPLMCSLLVYPWEKLSKDSVICDVAGGNGHKVLLLLQHFSGLKAVVQDEASVIAEAKKVDHLQSLDKVDDVLSFGMTKRLCSSRMIGFNSFRSISSLTARSMAVMSTLSVSFPLDNL